LTQVVEQVEARCREVVIAMERVVVAVQGKFIFLKAPLRLV
jgi:hypothetical protein